MKLLVVNVNTTESMTASIGDAARSAASPKTEIIEVTPRIGADSIEGNFESFLAAVAVMDAVVTFPDPFDAVIQAGFGEHGKEGLMELLDVPVVDITDAAAHFAHLLGHRYSVITTLDRTVPLIEDRLHSSGLDAHCVSVRASGLGVLELENTELAKEALLDQARRAIQEDNSEVIILGCGGMAGLDEYLQSCLSVPVVDGVAAAVKLAEDLVELNLTTSKQRTYAAIRPKDVRGWPLSAYMSLTTANNHQVQL